MGRPPLGKAGKSVTASVKITGADRDRLIVKYGSVYAGLRMGVQLALSSEVVTPQRRAKKVSTQKAVEDDVIATAVKAELPAPTLEPVHRHKRGIIVGHHYEQGQKRLTYACSVDGCKKEMK